MTSAVIISKEPQKMLEIHNKKILQEVATPKQPASTSYRYWRIVGKQSYQQALSIGFQWLLWELGLPDEKHLCQPPSMDPENNGV